MSSVKTGKSDFSKMLRDFSSFEYGSLEREGEIKTQDTAMLSNRVYFEPPYNPNNSILKDLLANVSRDFFGEEGISDSFVTCNVLPGGQSMSIPVKLGTLGRNIFSNKSFTKDIPFIDPEIKRQFYSPTIKKIEQEVLPVVEPEIDNGLSVIQDAIEKASYIKELEDDWDGEGAKGYSQDIWNKVIDFITKTSKRFHRTSGFWVSPPEILPVPNGSIDVHWTLPKRQILVNIPALKEFAPSFCGYDDGVELIEGKLDLSLDNEWILVWLMK